jgi:hypothetical protein
MENLAEPPLSMEDLQTNSIDLPTYFAVLQSKAGWLLMVALGPNMSVLCPAKMVGGMMFPR